MVNDKIWIEKAIEIAKISAEHSNEVPVGCIITRNNKELSKSSNQRESTKLVTSHAEIIALNRAAEKTGDWRLEGCSVFVTLEPCPMCAAALIEARVSKVVFSVFDYKNGAFGGKFDLRKQLDKRGNKIEIVTGIKTYEYQEVLKQFFTKLRN